MTPLSASVSREPFFLRAEYTEAWALGGLGGPAIANLLHPGADRLIFFDVVASGRCWESLAANVTGRVPAT